MVAIFSSAGCKFKDNGEVLYILSKSFHSKKAKVTVSEEKFQAVMAQTVVRSHRSTLAVLEQNEDDGDLQLSRMTLGLTLEAEVGIDDVLEIGKEAAFELRFERLPLPK
ncbi:MAG: hypothetical protein ACXWRZ_15695 [Bdellovibrio sp.]